MNVNELGVGVNRISIFSLPGGKVIPQGPDTRSRGKEVSPGYPGREAGLGHVFAITSCNHKIGLDITPETPIPQWHGEQMDDGMAVDMLLQCE